MTWQPIETAPRDGTEVMLWCDKFAGEISGVYVTTGPAFGMWDGGKSDYPGDDWWNDRGGDAYAAWCRPTHWMPLPEAPE